MSTLPPRAVLFFYRTRAGAEIDLVIEHAGGRRWAIAIKRSPAAGIGRSFHLARADVRAERALVGHAGDDRYPVSEALAALSVRAMAADLRDQPRGGCGSWSADAIPVAGARRRAGAAHRQGPPVRYRLSRVPPS